MIIIIIITGGVRSVHGLLFIIDGIWKWTNNSLYVIMLTMINEYRPNIGYWPSYAIRYLYWYRP